MLSHTKTRSGAYYDSVVLMRLSDGLRQLDGVHECLVAMGTELNLALLEDLDFDITSLGEPSSTDMVVAIRAMTQTNIDDAIAWLDGALVAKVSPSGGGPADIVPRTLGTAVKAVDANVTIISVPGDNVVPEAMDAIRASATTMIFSDGISVADERRLKQAAVDNAVLVMGPDCGTAIIGGVGFGFANQVRRGSIGLVAASGTGAQHLSCLLHKQGFGISHILGVGGRDLNDGVGGLSTLQALALLDSDPDTDHIVIVSKPPGPATAEVVTAAADALATPVTMGLLGVDDLDLTKLAALVVEAFEQQLLVPRADISSVEPHETGVLVGLFSGGTLATEARSVLGSISGSVADIDAFGSAPTPAAIAAHSGHVLVDLGDDRMTVGRPHPMIDSTVRRDIIDELAGKTSSCRHLFIDVVLGYAASPDPVGDLSLAIGWFVEAHRGNTVTATLIGTDEDPQGLERQRQALVDLGCDVYESNAMAAAAIKPRLRTETANV